MEIGFAFLSSHLPTYNCQGTLSDCVACGMDAQTLAFRRLIEFRSFRLLPQNDLLFAFKGRRKQQKSIKVGNCSCYQPLAVALLHYL